jgi:hypothetical protein
MNTCTSSYAAKHAEREVGYDEFKGGEGTRAASTCDVSPHTETS